MRRIRSVLTIFTNFLTRLLTRAHPPRRRRDPDYIADFRMVPVAQSGKAPLLVTTIVQLREALSALRKDAETIGLVPTMGALHEGHLSLVAASRNRCTATVVSIFVNPAQFAPGEDLGAYPRQLDRDLEMLAAAGADLVFAPEVETIYPADCSTAVDPPAVAHTLEGQSRPTHFRGVATVVLKLFNLVPADMAFFGQKDYQQTLVIRHMVRDLNLPIDIVVCPIVRDDDGLALSSRNSYLDPDERLAARSLHRSLQRAAASIDQGETDGRVIMADMTQALIEGGVSTVDYAVLAHPETLQLLEDTQRPAVLLVAARVGATRLIDNLIVT